MRTLTHHTPAGTLITIVEDQTVVAAGFTDDPGYLSGRMGLDGPPPPRQEADEEGRRVAEAISAYLSGDVSALEEVAVAQPGTQFQRSVWSALRAVRPGKPATYTDLARAVGRPAAVRAVGSACGRNLIAPFVPCHRALRSDGSLGGYLYGLPVKEWLIAHESGQALQT